jgi:hypothetical protein
LAIVGLGVALGAAACESGINAPISPSAMNTASLADTGENNKYYKATIAPTSVVAGATDTTFTVRITNCSSGVCSPDYSGTSANLQSANVVVPAGFTNITNLSVQVSNGGTWDTPVLDGSTIKTDKGGGSDGLAPGAWVEITFHADAPCDVLLATFQTAAFQEPDNVSTPFTLTSPTTYPTVDVTAGSCSLDEDCPAAPAIAAHYLHDHGVRPGTSTYDNIVAAVADHMGPETDFNGIGKCAEGYAAAVEGFVQNLIDQL